MSDTLSYLHSIVDRLLEGAGTDQRQPSRCSACAGLCTSEHVISPSARPQLGTRRVALSRSSERGARKNAAARSTRARAAASRSSLSLSPSRRPQGLKLPGRPGPGEGRKEGLLWEQRGIPPSTERSRLFIVFTSAAGGNPRLQLLLTSPCGATAPRAPLPPGPP